MRSKKKQELLLANADLLEGVDGDVRNFINEKFLVLPFEEDNDDEYNEENIPLIDAEIDVNKEIDPDELVDLLDYHQADRNSAEQEESQENQDNTFLDDGDIDNHIIWKTRTVCPRKAA